MNIYHNAAAMVGETPLLKLGRLIEKYGCQAEVAVKLEYFNPASSIKDRIARSMVEDAEKRGLLVPHSSPAHVLVEPTSGNTGIGLAFMAATHGYRLILTMPESMSEERKKLLRGLGAELVLTPAAAGMLGAAEEAGRIAAATPGAVILGQFSNPANPLAHYHGTGPEIWQQCGGKVDVFVAGIGSGGTVTGVGRYLKERSKTVKIFGVEPAESPLLSQGKAGPHLIQGIGANFVPEVLDRSLLDGVITVPGEKALQTTRELMQVEGVICGISSGANVFAAMEIARNEKHGRRIVTVACDTAERYLSTRLFQD